MKFYKGDVFIQPIIILKDDGSGPEDLTDKTVTLLLIDQKGTSDKTVSGSNVAITDPLNGEVDFQPQDATVLDTVTDYKLRAKITSATGATYQRHTEPGVIIVEDPNA